MSSSLIGYPIHSALCSIEAKSFVNYYIMQSDFNIHGYVNCFFSDARLVQSAYVVVKFLDKLCMVVLKKVQVTAILFLTIVLQCFLASWFISIMHFPGWVLWYVNPCRLFNAKSSLYIYIKKLWFGLVVFYGISTLVGYLMPNPVYTYILKYMIWYGWVLWHINHCRLFNDKFCLQDETIKLSS